MEKTIEVILFRKPSMAKEARQLLNNGTLRKHILNYIANFDESESGAYGVKVSTSGMITVGGLSRQQKAQKDAEGATIYEMILDGKTQTPASGK